MNYSEIYKNKIDKLIENEVNSGNIKGASALVFYLDKEIYEGYHGYADAEKNTAMKRDTIIRLFSMTKPVTAVAAMIAMENGYIDLNDPVSKYLPEYAELTKIDENGNISRVNNQMNLMHLLTMTSGIPYGECWEGCSQSGRLMQTLFDRLLADLKNGKKYSTREMARMFAEVPIAFEPGTTWKYGLSADVMGAVIEVATGMKYSDYLKQYIFEPLDMKDTGFYVPAEKQARFAMSYDFDYSEKTLTANTDSYLCEYYGVDVSFESGGAGLVSTIEDYSHFALMLVNGGIYKGKRIIGRASVRYLSKNHLTEVQASSLDWDNNRGYGYGCLVRVLVNQGKAGTQGALGEFGWDGWTGNYFCVDPENKLVILYFIQLRGAGTTPVVRKIRAATYGMLDELN